MSGPEAEAARRVADVRRRIEAACRRTGRDPRGVVLVAASKSQPVERMRAAWLAGIRVFGENRVQEAAAKMPLMPQETEWHLIGPLQSNKAKRAATLFRCIHSIDRLKIARAVANEAARRGSSVEGFIEVNLADEESKHGFAPEDLARRVRPLAELEGLKILGLMAIPPYEEEADAARRWFRRLRELRDETFSRPEWQGRRGLLSMGMSHDFEAAIEEGATHVRIGTALLGPRDGEG